MRLQDTQRYEVITFCTNYLFDKYPNEKGLFRSSVSQTEVRLLQTQIVQRSIGYRDDLDPNVVAEVLQASLKDLSSPLFHEVYKDVVHTELIEDDYDLNKSTVQRWILKIPETKFEIANLLFKLLNRLAAMEENEASLMQLAYSISPTICRPMTSAYMSIRHMEDLKKIRPVILFLIENHSEIFLINRFSSSFHGSSSGGRSPIIELNDMDKAGGILSDIMASAMVIDSHKAQVVDQKLAVSTNDTTGEFPFVKPNLLVMIPTGNNSASEVSSNSSVEMEADNEKPQSFGHSYSDTEWKILYALVNTKVANYMDLEEKDTADFVAAEANGDAHHVFMQSWTARVTSLLNSTSTMKSEANTLPGSPTGSIGLGNKSNSSSLNKSYARRIHRRRMVADCKSLRAQIYEFEQEFTKKYGRAPKTQDRGPLQTVYSKYRDLKREIRDGAATDIQRVIRGYNDRKKLRSENRILFHRVIKSQHSTAMDVSSSSGGNAKKSDAFSYKDAADSTGGSGAGFASQSELFTKLRDLLEQKKDLKKKLKKFDEDFLEQNGRAPKKADKEVIRPMYQKYHELKGAIDNAKKVVTSSGYAIPEDLSEEFLGINLGSSLRSADSKRNYIGIGSGSRDELSDMEADDKAQSKGTMSKSNSKSALSDDEGEWSTKSQPPNLNSSINLSTLNIQAMTAAEKSKNLEALLQEKKNLHAYLKVYERDFNRSHGRPVMKNEDILPVANEYQRYKELKNLIKELKS